LRTAEEFGTVSGPNRLSAEWAGGTGGRGATVLLETSSAEVMQIEPEGSMAGTCGGTRTSDSSNCTEIEDFVTSPVVDNCPTSDGCTFAEGTPGYLNIYLRTPLCRTPEICDNGIIAAYTTCEVTLDLDMASVGEEGTLERLRFKESFASELEVTLGAASGDVIVTAISAGSIVVEFDMIASFGEPLATLVRQGDLPELYNASVMVLVIPGQDVVDCSNGGCGIVDCGEGYTYYADTQTCESDGPGLMSDAAVEATATTFAVAGAAVGTAAVGASVASAVGASAAASASAGAAGGAAGAAGGAGGAGGAGAGGQASAGGGAGGGVPGDPMSVVFAIQFVALLGQLNAPIEKSFRSLTLSFSWANLQFGTPQWLLDFISWATGDDNIDGKLSYGFGLSPGGQEIMLLKKGE
jgi:hypothetical protein